MKKKLLHANSNKYFTRYFDILLVEWVKYSTLFCVLCIKFIFIKNIL